MLELEGSVSPMLLDPRMGVEEGGNRGGDSTSLPRLSVAIVPARAIVSVSVMINFAVSIERI